MKITQLLQESFFDQYEYEIPSDKRELMFDFYLLSYLSKSDVSSSTYLHDESVENAINRARQRLFTYLKEDILNAVYFSICSEARHVFDKQQNKSVVKKVMTKMKSPKYAEYKKYQKSAAILRNRKNRIKSYAKISAAYGNNRRAAVQDMYYIFEEGRWQESYGGPAWANVCKGWMLLYDAREINDIQVYIDHVYDLQHNTGTAFNKYAEYEIENDFRWLNDSLAYKAQSSTPYELYLYASFSMKRLASRILKTKKGTTYEAWQTSKKSDIYISMVLHELRLPELKDMIDNKQIDLNKKYITDLTLYDKSRSSEDREASKEYVIHYLSRFGSFGIMTIQRKTRTTVEDMKRVYLYTYKKCIAETTNTEALVSTMDYLRDYKRTDDEGNTLGAAEVYGTFTQEISKHHRDIIDKIFGRSEFWEKAIMGGDISFVINMSKYMLMCTPPIIPPKIDNIGFKEIVNLSTSTYGFGKIFDCLKYFDISSKQKYDEDAIKKIENEQQVANKIIELMSQAHYHPESQNVPLNLIKKLCPNGDINAFLINHSDIKMKLTDVYEIKIGVNNILRQSDAHKMLLGLIERGYDVFSKDMYKKNARIHMPVRDGYFFSSIPNLVPDGNKSEISYLLLCLTAALTKNIRHFNKIVEVFEAAFDSPSASKLFEYETQMHKHSFLDIAILIMQNSSMLANIPAVDSSVRDETVLLLDRMAVAICKHIKNIPTDTADMIRFYARDGNYAVFVRRFCRKIIELTGISNEQNTESNESR